MSPSSSAEEEEEEEDHEAATLASFSSSFSSSSELEELSSESLISDWSKASIGSTGMMVGWMAGLRIRRMAMALC